MPDLFSPFEQGSRWDDCYLAWLRALWSRSQSRETVLHYWRTSMRFFHLVDTTPEQVSRAEVESFLATKTRAGATPATATRNHRLCVLSSFYRFTGEYFASTPQQTLHNPTTGLHYSKSRRVYRYMSAEELERFFAVIPSDERGLRDRALFLFYFWTARRREEIARLTWGDISQGVIVSEDGKTRRVGWLYRFYGKGQGEREDVAELPGPAKAALDRYLLASGRMATMRAESPLFTHVDNAGLPLRLQGAGERRLSGGAIRRRLKIYAKRAGLDTSRITVHSLRHTAARQRYQAGEDLRSISRLLRHASLGTTDVYLQQLVGTEDTGASLLEQQWGHLSSSSPTGQAGSNERTNARESLSDSR